MTGDRRRRRAHPRASTPTRSTPIPANVTGSIVPKTLFGEKYVSLRDPGGRPRGDSIEAGAIIERTQVSTEVEKVLSDLYPLLRTVQPAEINMTLNALATALEGRGDQLGENLETLDSYLKRLNPQIPALIEDLRLTAEVSDIYAEVLPEVATILDNTVTTTGTLEDREDKLNALFNDVAGFSDTARTSSTTTSDNMIRLGEVSAAQLRVLARYSTEFPCLIEGIVKAGDLQAEAFRGFTLHIVLETLPNQPRALRPQDEPRFGENRGPSCLNLPDPPWIAENPVRRQPDFNDGVDEPTGKGTSRAADRATAASTPASSASRGTPAARPSPTCSATCSRPAWASTADEVPDLGAAARGPDGPRRRR